VIIEPSSARAFTVGRGRRLVVRDVEGAQVADVVCYAYEVLLGAGVRDGCFENLGRALAPFDVPARLVTDPFNVFMSTRVGEDHGLVIERAPSKPGDYVVLETLVDCVFGVSACADDVTDCNGGVCTPIEAEIL